MPEVCVNITHPWVWFVTCFHLHAVGSVLQHCTLNKFAETALLSLLLLPGMHLWLDLTASVRLLLCAHSTSQRFSSCLALPPGLSTDSHPWVPKGKSGSSNSTAPSWPRNPQTQLTSTSHQASSALGWFQKPESASEVSPGQLSCLQQILSKKIRRKEKNRIYLMWLLPGEYVLLWAEIEDCPFSWDARTQHPQCHNLLIKQCHKLELSSRIQAIFEASHLLLHP